MIDRSMSSLKNELKFLFHDQLVYGSKTIADVFNNEGILALFKKGFIYYFPSVLLIPFIGFYKRKLEKSSVSSLVSFSYNFLVKLLSLVK